MGILEGPQGNFLNQKKFIKGLAFFLANDTIILHPKKWSATGTLKTE
jgi:hypothetical protein